MPRRAAPGRRDRIEEVLDGVPVPARDGEHGPTMLDAVRWLAEMCGADDWQQSLLIGPVQVAATSALAARIAVAQGVAPTSALETAAARLGTNADTVRRTVEGNGASAANLIRRAA